MLLVTNSRIYSINCKNWLCPWELITAFDALGIIYLRGTIYRQTLILFYVRASWFIGPSLPLQVVSPWTEFNNHYVLRVWKFVLSICLCECVYLSIFNLVMRSFLHFVVRESLWVFFTILWMFWVSNVIPRNEWYILFVYQKQYMFC